MRNEILEVSRGDQIDRPTPTPSVERADPSELDTVARVLAAGYAEDPVPLWAMPKAATRLADATVFFTVFLHHDPTLLNR